MYIEDKAFLLMFHMMFIEMYFLFLSTEMFFTT